MKEILCFRLQYDFLVIIDKMERVQDDEESPQKSSKISDMTVWEARDVQPSVFDNQNKSDECVMADAQSCVKPNRPRLPHHTKCTKTLEGKPDIVRNMEEPMFDKLPSYLTVLSLPNKLYNKGDSKQLLMTNDHFPQRDPSPERDSSQYNKIPAYHNCFTNSTKYDQSGDPLAIESDSDDCPSNLFLDTDTDSSRSRSSSCSSCSSAERSRSKKRKHKCHRSSGSRSNEKKMSEAKKIKLERKKRQIKERRIVYVGRIPRECTKKDLRRLFENYGNIEVVNVHKREHGDNFGFVTFQFQCDAYSVIETYQRNPQLKDFDICFGGRRQFCMEGYADLDAKKELEEELNPLGGSTDYVDFGDLLKQTKRLIKSNQD